MNKAVSALDGTELDGRSINVRIAGDKPPEKKTGGASDWKAKSPREARGPENKVFCGSLSWGVDKDKLWAAFEGCPGLVDAFVCTDRESGQSRGFGFCKFDSEENMNAAIEKMNGAEVDGRAINVNAAQAKPADGAAAPAPAPASNKRTWEEPAAEEAAAEEEVAEEEPKKKKKKKAKTEDADAEEETPKKKKKKVRSLR